MRSAAAVFVAIAAFFFSFWIGGALLSLAGMPDWTDLPVAIAVAMVAARFVWRGSESPGLLRSVTLGAMLTGAIGFSLGFFGPLILTPDANQGPLLGLFITGPLGLALGALGGAVRWMWRREA